MAYVLPFLNNITQANPLPDLAHMHPHPRAALHLLQRKDILLHPRRQSRTDQWKRQCDASPQVSSRPRERRTLARPRQHQRHEQPEGDSGDRQQRHHTEDRDQGKEGRRYHGYGNRGYQGGGSRGSTKRRVPSRREVDIEVDIEYTVHNHKSLTEHSCAPLTRL